MRIEVRGRNVEVTDELREHVAKRFARTARQVSELARLEVELSEERNPSIADSQIAEATLYRKAINHDPHFKDIRRQVMRHRETRRGRASTRRAAGRWRGRTA